MTVLCELLAAQVDAAVLDRHRVLDGCRDQVAGFFVEGTDAVVGDVGDVPCRQAEVRGFVGFVLDCGNVNQENGLVVCFGRGEFEALGRCPAFVRETCASDKGGAGAVADGVGVSARRDSSVVPPLLDQGVCAVKVDDGTPAIPETQPAVWDCARNIERHGLVHVLRFKG